LEQCPKKYFVQNKTCVQKTKGHPYPMKKIKKRNSAIVLGLRENTESEPIGFSLTENKNTDAEPKPIEYNGDAPLLTIAPTGAGKGVSAIIPTALTNTDPMIIIDPKGEAYQITASARKRMGHKVVLIDPFDYCGEGASDGLNPLDLINPESPTAVDDALSLANALVQTKSVSDPFWDQRAQQLYSGIILWIAAYAPKPQRHLGTLRKILNTNDKARATVLAAMAKSNLWDGRISDSAHILPDAPDKTRGSIMSTAQSHVDFMSSLPVVNSITASSITLDEIKNGDPVTIYLVLPPERLESHGQLLRLWLTTIITTITRRRKAPKTRTLLVVDEAAQLGNLPALKSALTLLRGYGLTTWTFWQSPSQLQSVYPKDWRTIIDNAAVVQAFGFYTGPFLQDIKTITGLEVGTTLSAVQGNKQVIALSGEDAFVGRRVSYLTDSSYKGLWNKNHMIDTAKTKGIENVV